MKDNLVSLQRTFNKSFRYKELRKQAQFHIENILKLGRIICNGERIQELDKFVMRYEQTILSFKEEENIIISFGFYEDENDLLSKYTISCIYDSECRWKSDLIKKNYS